jgi:rod shape-determining protein MreC
VAANGNNRSRLLLVILLVTSLFLITLDLRGVSITKTSRTATQSFLAPVQRTVSDFFSPVGNFFSDVKNFGKTKAELTAIKAQNEKLKGELVINADIQGQLDKLKAALNLAGRGKFQVVSGRVIGEGSASTFSQTITIDAGSKDGVKKDMTVVSGAGLVGIVKETTANSSIVLLMSDPTFRVGVRIARSQGVGVLLGQGNGSYLLQLLDAAGTIKKGDQLLTLGSDGNRPFVAGIPVGQVISVNDTTASLTQEANVKGFVSLNNLGVVSVIVGNLNNDPKNALVPTPDPVVTRYVTETLTAGAPIPGTTPTPSVSTKATPTPAPTASKKKA